MVPRPAFLQPLGTRRGVQLGRERKRTLVSSIDILDLTAVAAYSSQTLPKCESEGPLTYSCSQLSTASRLLPRKGPSH